MKKRLMTIIAIAMASMLSACTLLPARQQNPTGPVSTSPTPFGGMPTSTPTPTPTPTSTPTPTPSPTPDPKTAFIEKLNESEIKGTYVCPIDVPLAANVETFLLDDAIIMHYQSYYDDYTHIDRLVSYDRETFEVIKEIQLRDESAPSDDGVVVSVEYLDGEYIYVCVGTEVYWDEITSYYDYEYRVYDAKLNLIAAFTMVDRGEVSNVYRIPGTSKLMFIDQKAYLTEVDIHKENPEKLVDIVDLDALDEAWGLTHICGSKYHAVVMVENPEIPDEWITTGKIIDIDNKTAELTDLKGIYGFLGDEETGRVLRICYNPSVSAEVVDKDGNLLQKLNLESSSEDTIIEADWKNNVVITSYSTSDNDTAKGCIKYYRCYSMETGEVISDLIVRGYHNETPAFAVDPELGLAFVPTGKVDFHEFDERQLLCWDYMNDGRGDEKAVIGRTSNIHQEFSPSIEKYRKDLEERFGINIYLGEEIKGVNYGYDLEVVTDEDMIYFGLQTIEEALGIYPEGFLKQISNSGSIMSLGFYLCGNMTNTGDGGVDSAIGLASFFGYERSLALDIGFTSELERTIYHEISHWIDKVIYEGEQLGKISDFEEGFNMLNPFPDYYNNSYSDYYDLTDFTFWGDEKDYREIYSVDAYARTYPTEDRARMFENLIVPDPYDFYRCRNMLAKYEYFFNAIRQCFDTNGWPEKTVWEQNLEDWQKKYEEEQKAIDDDRDEKDKGPGEG